METPLSALRMEAETATKIYNQNQFFFQLKLMFFDCDLTFNIYFYILKRNGFKSEDHESVLLTCRSYTDLLKQNNV